METVDRDGDIFQTQFLFEGFQFLSQLTHTTSLHLSFIKESSFEEMVHRVFVTLAKMPDLAESTPREFMSLSVCQN